MKLKGKLEQQRLGMIVWVLTTDGGVSYQLKGTIPPELAGRQVQVTADRAEQQFGVAMVGEILDVKRIKAS